MGVVKFRTRGCMLCFSGGGRVEWRVGAGICSLRDSLLFSFSFFADYDMIITDQMYTIFSFFTTWYDEVLFPTSRFRVRLS